MTRSVPWLLTKKTSQRLCSSSKRLATCLKARSFWIFLSSFSSFSTFFEGVFLSPSKSARLARSWLGPSSVTCSSRMRLFSVALIHFVEEAEVFLELGHETGEAGAFEIGGALAVADDDAVGGALEQDLVEGVVVFDVLQAAALLEAVEGRLGDEDVAALDEFGHVAEEEGEQQGADVRAIDVGVGHEDDLAVADFGGIEVVFGDAGAEGGNHGADFFVRQHFVVAGLFDVEDFALEREDGLEAAVAALFGGAAGGFALDQEQFAAIRLALRAVGELAGEASAIEGAFAAGEVAGLAGGLAGAGGFDRLVDDLAGDGGVLLEEGAQLFVDERLHDAGDVGVPFAFGLAFELGLGKFDADDGDQAFADVIAGEVLFDVFKEAELLAGVIDGAGEGGAEAGQVGAAIDGVDVVGEAENVLGVAVVVLQADLHDDAVFFGFHVDGLVVQDLLAPIEVLDEFGDAAVVLEVGMLGLAGLGVHVALIGEGDEKALVEESEFAQALGEGVVVIFGLGKDGLVGKETDL